MLAARGDSRSADLVVVGAGIVGLSVAYDGLLRGLKVLVVEQDERPVGASVRNFGHGCITAQTGDALRYAQVARERWLALRDAADLWVQETGTVVVARREEELAVVREFCAANPGDTELLTAAQVLERAPLTDAVMGGAFLANDVRVDPRTATPALASYLKSQGVELHFRTTALTAEPGRLVTSRFDVTAPAIVFAVGDGLDRMLPDEADKHSVARSTLQMLRVTAPDGLRIEPAVLTGTSLLRYSGFLACPSSPALREALQRDRPELLDAVVNHMLTQHPSGDLIIGDTHSYDLTPAPFSSEELDELLLSETRELLGVQELEVRERWRGTYAWSPDHEYVTVTPCDGVRSVTVTSGIGMTTALGFAHDVVEEVINS